MYYLNAQFQIPTHLLYLILFKMHAKFKKNTINLKTITKLIRIHKDGEIHYIRSIN